MRELDAVKQEAALLQDQMKSVKQDIQKVVTLGNPKVHIFEKSSNSHEHCKFSCEKS